MASKIDFVPNPKLLGPFRDLCVACNFYEGRENGCERDAGREKVSRTPSSGPGHKNKTLKKVPHFTDTNIPLCPFPEESENYDANRENGRVNRFEECH